MRCQDVMPLSVFVCDESETVRACARIMRDRKVGLLPVLDDACRVLGVITDRDLAIRVLAGGLPDDTPVRAVMTRDFVACRPETGLREVEDLMARTGKSRILVTEPGGRCLGVLSLSDVAKAESSRKSGEILQAVAQRR